MPLRPLLTWLTLAWFVIPLAHAQTEVAEVPKGAKITIEFDKAEFFLGENILLHFVIENTDAEAFSINLGGDYRGASRSLRFHVTLTDEKGVEVADPDPSSFCMGGLSHSPSIAPGQKHYESLQLLRYARLEKPGVYKVRASHDLGWTPTKERPVPVGQGTLKVVMPTADQARKVIQEMDRLAKDHGGVSGKRRKAFADYSALRFPPYLPLLTPRVDSGDENGLTAIGAMPDPKATAYLIELLDHRDPKFRRKVVQTLNWRLPDPLLEGKLPSRNFFDNDREEPRRWLVKQAWKAEFAPAVRRAAAKLLDETEVEALQCGGYMLQCLGQKEDFAALVVGLNRAIRLAEDSAPETGVYPRPRGACMELVRAATAMLQRGLEPPVKLQTPGDRVIFALALKHGNNFRPKDWKQTCAGLLGDDAFLVKQTTLRCLPDPSEPLFTKHLPDLLFDRDVDVRLAACHVAGESMAKELKEPLRRLLLTAVEEHLFSAACNAASAHLPRLERLRIFVDRLDEKDMSAPCLRQLTGILKGWSARQGPGTLDREQAAACKKAWDDFLSTREKELSEGRTYAFDDPTIPVQRLFPTTTFHAPK